jgi:ketosteroid isomerase-like protein
MSHRNVEIMRRLVDAINADAIPRELIAPDFELRNTTTAVTDATYFGYEGALKWRRDLFDVVDDPRFEVEILATGPDHLVTANRLFGRGSSSGAPVELRWSSVVWFEDGRLTRGVGYQRRREALEAMGLGPSDG